jgi:hypothetical protein
MSNRRDFMKAVVSAALASALWERVPILNAHPQGETLPFSIKVGEAHINKMPDYMGPGNPIDMDFPYCPVMIDGEYWVIYKNGYWVPVFRYKGTNIEDAVRQPDGAAEFPLRAPYMLGGMWHDASEKKLYAPLHCEAKEYAGNVDREIHLASSRDKGLTWSYEGAIVTKPDSTAASFQQYSGLYWDGGVGDHYLFVDTTGGYFYLFFPHYTWAKLGVGAVVPYVAPGFWHIEVARCAISDKMAPGKWRKFYNGNWDEPGLGGKASWVNGNVVTYNSYLKQYISLDYAGGAAGISVCSDLSKQDWTPKAIFPDGMPKTELYGLWLTDADRRDVFTSDRSVFAYEFWQSREGKRYRIDLSPGETTVTGYRSSGGTGTGAFTCMDPAIQPYAFVPLYESADPIESRRTRRIASTSPEVTYSGAWSEETGAGYYERTAKVSAAPSSSIQFSFRGKDVYWRPFMSEDCGKADVYIDDLLEKTVDCWASSAVPQSIAFIKTGLDPNVIHTIKIVVRGEKNSLSKGAAVKHMLFEYSAETYRASDCFSSVQGKNQWSQLGSEGGKHADLAFQDPVWRGEDGCEISFFHMIPGTSAEAVRQWVAPHDGSALIEGAPSVDSASKAGFVLTVLRNADEIWSARLEPPQQQASPHHATAEVHQGDAITFKVGALNPERKATESGLHVLAGRGMVGIKKSDGKPLKIRNQEYSGGITFLTVSKLAVRLPNPGKSFSCMLYAEDNYNKGSMLFSVVVGGKTCFRSEVLKGEMKGVPVNVNLNGATEFVMEVGSDGSGNISDLIVAADPKTILADGQEVWLANLPLEYPDYVLWDPVITFVENRR